MLGLLPKRDPKLNLDILLFLCVVSPKIEKHEYPYQHLSLQTPKRSYRQSQFIMVKIDWIIESCFSIYSTSGKCPLTDDLFNQRGSLLVDNSPGIQAEVRGWESAYWGWPHLGQCVFWEVPGEYLVCLRLKEQCSSLHTTPSHSDHVFQAPLKHNIK